MPQRGFVLVGLLLTVSLLAVGQITDDPTNPGYVHSFQFSADGKSILGYTGTTLLSWDLETRKLIQRQKVEAEDGTFVQIGKLLSIVRDDNGIHVTDLVSNQELKFINGVYLYNTSKFAFNPDATTLAFDDREVVKLWDLTTAKEKPSITRTNPYPADSGRDDFMQKLRFSPDGKTLAGLSGIITLWSSSTGKQLRSIEINAGLMRMDFTPDGKMICVSGFDNIEPSFIKCFDVSSGREALSVAADSSSPFAISPDGKVLALSRSGAGIVLITMATGKEIGQITVSVDGHYLTEMSFSPNGKFLAVASADGLVLLDPATKKQLFILGARIR